MRNSLVVGGGWRVLVGVLVSAWMDAGRLDAGVVITSDQKVTMGGSGLNSVVPDGAALTMGEFLSGYAHVAANTYEVSVSFRLMPDVTNPNPQLNYMVSGDYRVFLRHGSGLGTPDTVGSFLLKNVGQEYVFPEMGYSDGGGMDIILEDLATHSIQGYRSVVTGSHSVAVTGVLGGTWQPLEAMNPLGAGDPNGYWSLVFEDSILGGQAFVESWSIALTPVPEPGSATLLILGLAAVLARSRRG